MQANIAMTRNGIMYESGGTRLCLDPRAADPGAVNFVSHAHTDHLPSKNGGTILCSEETGEIAELRGFKMGERLGEREGFELLDSGHILGARGLLHDGMFYTGDICTRDRGFLRGARVPRCKTLITECTFGLPEFAFPPMAQTQRRANEIISELYGRGVPVILMGYQLGKAQTITQLFGHWDPLYLHDSIKEMNRLHRGFGVPLRDAMGHTEAQGLGLLDRKPWVMVAPMLPAKNGFVKEMKSRYGAVTVGFSGWAASAKYPFARGADYAVPLSDHCDFGELVGMVARSGAEKVYTVHGFVKEFAAHLRNMGIDAEPLQRAG